MLCWDRGQCTHIFQAAHEVVADGGAWQVGCVQATPYVEEVIGAQHGVVLLSVAGGGENPVHQYRHLEENMGIFSVEWRKKNTNWTNYFMLHFLIVTELG